MEGNLGDFSQTIYMANQASGAGGIKDWPDNPYRDNNIGWLSAMGYNGLFDYRLDFARRFR